jgi:hypothetical protein
MKLARTALVTVFLAGWSLAAEEPRPAAAAQDSNSGVFVDKDGKKKKTVKTPFGTSVRAADPEPDVKRTLADDPLVRVEEKGDTFTFRRQTPFGDQVWKKKRAELTPEEQSLIAARKAAASAPVAKPAAPAPAKPPATK